MTRAVLTLVLVLAGCGGGEGPLLRTYGYAPRPHARRTYARPSAQEMLSGRPFAETPITPFAESLADLALAAIEARPLPPSPVPTETPLDRASVDWPSTPLRSSQLTVLAVGIELDLVLKRGEPPPDAIGPARWGELRVTIALSRNGLRLIELRPAEMRDASDGGALPAGLEGLDALSRDLLARLRTGDLSVYELTDDDRRLLANDFVWSRVQHDRPHHGRLRDVQAMLASLPDGPIAYRLDDVAVLARDSDNRLYSLSFDLDPQGGSFVLDTEPLVTVRRLWPRD